MVIRELSEATEAKILAPWAQQSVNAVRVNPEEPDDMRTAYQRDRDRIIHSMAFRKLKHKTQVYLNPGDHYRTRLTHSMEVSQIARTIARALRLNEDLTEAAALGHVWAIRRLVMRESAPLMLIPGISGTMNKACV